MNNRHLLLDPRIVNATNNAELTVVAATKHNNNPLFGEDNPWEIRFDNLYPNVIYDREERLFKTWYSPFTIDLSSAGMSLPDRQKISYEKRRHKHIGKKREMGICYATSVDGINWEKPKLGNIEFDKSVDNNLVYRGPHGAGVIKDPRENDPSRRYKMFTSDGKGGMAVCFSSDGIHWDPLLTCPDINPSRVDGTHYNVIWVEELGEWAGFTRLRNERQVGLKTIKNRYAAWPIRQVGRTVSQDFVHWSQATPIMEGLHDNLQIYSMPVFRHGNTYLGLPVIHNQITDRAWTELAWSPDTIAWQRVCPGSALIPNSDPVGSYDFGCAYSSAYPIFLKDEIRLYYGASDYLHFGWREGFFCLASLRPDGFAGYQQISSRRPATVETVPIRCAGSTFHVSADIDRIGSIQVQIFGGTSTHIVAESEVIEEAITDGVVKWKDDFSIQSLSGEEVRIQFIVNGGKLYSFGFDLT